MQWNDQMQGSTNRVQLENVAVYFHKQDKASSDYIK